MLYMERVIITTDYIKLGQLLKLLGLVDTGGSVTVFLLSNEVEVDDMPETRRGRKLYPGSIVKVDGVEYEICK